MVKVIVYGAMGRMGRDILESLSKEPDMTIVAGIDRAAKATSLQLSNGSSIPLQTALPSPLTRKEADVIVDFSLAEATMPAARLAIPAGINMVIGTTGMSPENTAEIERLCLKHDCGVVVASNFAIGAVLMIHMARIASRFFEYAEILEMHHERKLDAPSGTALTTAKAMADARRRPFNYQAATKETVKGTRGGEVSGIAIHSVRMPGLLAHQEIIWVKARGVLTHSHYLWSHEPCMYGWVQGQPPSKKPPSNERTVWQLDQQGSSMKIHPTQKPVELFMRPIKYHTEVGDMCYEPFLGSGTQIIAAERLARRCYAMEQEPQYVDVAVLRWEAFSGQKAVREEA